MVVLFWALGCETQFHNIGETADTAVLDTTSETADTSDADTSDSLDTGIGPNPPVAICGTTSPASLEIGAVAHVTGSGSVDLSGGDLRYRWSLRKPPGSDAVLSSTDAVDASFTLDIAGSYFADLVVTADDDRESPPCTVTFATRPVAGLDVTITWTVTNDDMDLHVLAPDGTLNTPTDCYYGTCMTGGLDWGAPGPDDDPVLDVQDTPGLGPEHMYITAPAAGIYTLIAHDYGTDGPMGADDVTMTVREGGEVVWTGTKAITGEDSYTTFATVTFPGGAVTPTP